MIPYTTLKKLMKAGACRPRYEHLVKSLGKWKHDKPIPLIKILETNGIDDVLWIPESAIIGDYMDRRYRLFAVACCQDILHLMSDERSVNAVKIAHLYAYGEATDNELSAARDAALCAARDAARDAACDAARDAALGAARDAARYATRKKQSEHFRIIFSAEFDD
jgi:hypothetical protein